jgi:predicted metal-dependent HD superfamily phosphohydrolase
MVSSLTSTDTAGAVDEARRLARGLDRRLRYHDARHTFGEVLPAARELAAAVGLDPRERALVEVAAAWHDLGLLETRQGHEQAGIRMARERLPRFGLSEAEIDAIAGMILATRLPQRPTTEAERVVADADLSVLASPDFLERNEDLRIETSLLDGWRPKLAWWTAQRRFLLAHVDHTEAARERYAAGRLRNAEALRTRARAYLDDLAT